MSNHQDKEIKIDPEDVKYFNGCCKELNDLNTVISKLEIDESMQLMNMFHFFSNLNDDQLIIESLKDKLQDISENIQFIHLDLNSPFNPIDTYCKNIYPFYEEMCKARDELDTVLNTPLGPREAAFLLNSIIQYRNDSNPFLLDLPVLVPGFSPERFNESLKTLKDCLNEKTEINEEKNDFNAIITDIQNLIIDCPYDEKESFLPFSKFYLYILDPSNFSILEKYFDKFVNHYFNIYTTSNPILRTFYSKPFIKINNSLISAIKKVIPQISDDKLQKVVTVIDRKLVLKFVNFYKKNSKPYNINYEDAYECHSLEELERYEATQFIKSLNANNIEILFDSKYIYISNLIVKYCQVISKNIIDVFEAIYSDANSSKIFKNVVRVLNIFYNFQNKAHFFYPQFAVHESENLKKAFNKGRKDMNGRATIFTRDYFLSDDSAEIEKLFANFQKEFLGMIDENVINKISYNNRFLFSYIHGFLSTFCEKLPRNITNSKDDNISICWKWVDRFCVIFHFNNNRFLFDGEEPFCGSENWEILSEYPKNTNIPKPKQECYKDFQSIIHKVIGE